MESTFGKCETGLCHTYKHIEIVEIDGKKYIKRKRNGQIIHANKEGISRVNSKRKVRRRKKCNAHLKS